MIQPMDAVVQALAMVNSSALGASCFGDGIARVEHEAEGQLVLHLVEAMDITTPANPIQATAGTPANTLEITATLDPLRVRVRMFNPATGVLRGGTAWIMIMRRPLGVVPSS